MKTIADRIKEGLHARDMLQSDLAEKTGLPKSAISSYVNGKYEPKQNAIHLIAKALDVNITWLMGYDVPMNDMRDESSDEEVAELLERLHKDPCYRALLSSSVGLKKEDVLMIKDIIDRINGRKND